MIRNPSPTPAATASPPPPTPRHIHSLNSLLTTLGFLSSLLTHPTPAATPLPITLRGFLEQPAFQHASWGVAVHDAASGQVLFETNSHRLLKPASCAKLFTAALALHSFGPHAHLATDLLPTGPISRRGTLQGNLIVRGGGDFSLAARFHQGNPTQAVHTLVKTLQTAGLRRLDGDVVADDALFHGPPFGNGWTWDDVRYTYGAEVSALSLEDNALSLELIPGKHPRDPVRVVLGPGASYLHWAWDGVHTGPTNASPDIQVQQSPGTRQIHLTGTLPANSPAWKEAVPVPQPALFFAHRLREALLAAGIHVSGQARHQPGAAQTLPDTPHRPAPLSILSPPMHELVRGMLKPSQNLYAQSLLLLVGSRSPFASSSSSSEEAGIRALEAFVQTAGIPLSEVRLDDGSGLSRSSLVTPSALVALLRFMQSHPHRDAFLEALPVAGQDGTLQRRFANTPLAGRIQAKTGTLRYVHTLAGFCTHPEGRRLVFAVMLNAYAPPPGGPSGREAIDGLLLQLAQSSIPDSL